MGFFDFLKKFNAKENTNARATQPSPDQITQKPQAPKTEVNSFGERLDRLTEDGELPWGWVTHNNDFTGKIGKEYTYFLNNWLDSRNKSPKEQYSALKSFILYLEDAEKLCKAKGECFELWFCEYLITKDYIKKRKRELEALTANLDELQSNFIKRNEELSGLDERIIKMLIDNPGILQSEFIKMFDSLIQNDVREKLYFMEKSGKLERTKSGRSYILHYKQ